MKYLKFIIPILLLSCFSTEKPKPIVSSPIGKNIIDTIHTEEKTVIYKNCFHDTLYIKKGDMLSKPATIHYGNWAFHYLIKRYNNKKSISVDDTIFVPKISCLYQTNKINIKPILYKLDSLSTQIVNTHKHIFKIENHKNRHNRLSNITIQKLQVCIKQTQSVIKELETFKAYPKKIISSLKRTEKLLTKIKQKSSHKYISKDIHVVLNNFVNSLVAGFDWIDEVNK